MSIPPPTDPEMPPIDDPGIEIPADPERGPEPDLPPEYPEIHEPPIIAPGPENPPLDA